MFEVGMGFFVRYASTTGEITSVSEDENGDTLIGVMFSDGNYSVSKTYTEDCVMQNLGRRIIVTETAFSA